MYIHTYTYRCMILKQWSKHPHHTFKHEKRSHPGGPTEGGNSVSSSRVGSSVIFRNRQVSPRHLFRAACRPEDVCIHIYIYYICIWLYMVIKLVWSNLESEHDDAQMMSSLHIHKFEWFMRNIGCMNLFRSRLRATDPIQIVGMSLMAWVPDTACQANPSLAGVVALYVGRVWILLFSNPPCLKNNHMTTFHEIRT